MKKISTLLSAILITASMFAQIPQKMSYQAVIRNSSNALIISKTVGMRISVLKGTSTGTPVYVETQTPTTNSNGLTSLEIGSGTVVSGNFSTINWASGPYFIKTETDPTGGTNYAINGTSELLSVPYALFAANGTNAASNYWTLTGTDIINNNTGKVGIGTSTPDDKLTVKTLSNSFGISHTDGTVIVGTYVGSGYGWLGTKSNHPLTFFTNNSGGLMTIATNGNVGIGNITPVNFFQVGTVTNGYTNYHVAFGNGSQSSGFTILPNGNSTWQSTLNISLIPQNGNGNGNVGINTQTPTNTLQIGSMGSTGYGGNALAIGEATGTSAMAFNQLAFQSNWQSSSNIYIKPLNGSAIGRVTNSGSEYITGSTNIGGDATIGGNTSMLGYVDISNSDGSHPGLTVSSNYAPATTPPSNSLTHCNGFCPNSDLSITADGVIWAQGFYALSDARYKDIEGVSNSANDLQTLNTIQITDYTLKDKRMNDRSYKKVIAQQVEKVYPQVVSQGTNCIPNVYQLTSKVEKTSNGYLLTFTDIHNISSLAKKLRIMLPEGMQEVEIVSLPTDKQVIINSTDLKTDKIFVYGEEVNDFRTVDYEGLSTLNISATQELSKVVKAQQLIIENQQKQIDLIEKRLSTWQASK